MNPRTDTQTHKHTAFLNRSYEFTKVVVPPEIIVRFYFLVMNPKTVACNDVYAQGFHFCHAFRPISRVGTRILIFAHDRKPALSVFYKPVLIITYHLLLPRPLKHVTVRNDYAFFSAFADKYHLADRLRNMYFTIDRRSRPGKYNRIAESSFISA